MTSSDEHLYRGDPPPAPPAGPQSTPGPGPQQAPPPDAGPVAPVPGYGPPGYGPPGYGPPGYGPPGYGPPGYGPAYPPAGFYRPPTNTMAILALVFAFVFAPAGIVLGVMARKQIRQTGEEGDGLALAGIIVGSIITGLYVLFIVFWIIAFASLAGSVSFGP
jgi:Domain of unknown function (DUF4190)